MEREYDTLKKAPYYTTKIYDAEAADNAIRSNIDDVKNDIHMICSDIKSDVRNVKIWVTTIALIIMFLVVVACDYIVKSRREENTKPEVSSEQILTELDETATDDMIFDCPFCDGTAHVYPVRNSWFIECDQCHIQTDYFDDKDKLIKYWMKVYGG